MTREKENFSQINKVNDKDRVFSAKEFFLVKENRYPAFEGYLFST
jgi:hypothetical protein